MQSQALIIYGQICEKIKNRWKNEKINVYLSIENIKNRIVFM
jgi:hypothetical protein